MQQYFTFRFSDLYGAIGYPARLARTVISGRNADVINRLLYILTYFVRCSQVFDNDTHSRCLKLDAPVTSSRRTRHVDIAREAVDDDCVLSRTAESNKSLATVVSAGSDQTQTSSTVCLQCGRNIDALSSSMTSSSELTGNFRSRLNSRAKLRDDVSSANVLGAQQRRDVIERLLNRSMDVTTRRSVEVDGAVTVVAAESVAKATNPVFPAISNPVLPSSQTAEDRILLTQSTDDTSACNEDVSECDVTDNCELPPPSLVLGSSTWYVTLEEMGAEHLRAHRPTCDVKTADDTDVFTSAAEPSEEQQSLCLNLNESNMNPENLTTDRSLELSAADESETTEQPTALDFHRIPLNRDAPRSAVTGAGPATRRSLVLMRLPGNESVSEGNPATVTDAEPSKVSLYPRLDASTVPPDLYICDSDPS